ncbi:MAG: ROK family protein [Bacteroidales bacterium]|nr:ROK family protein [Bacteroidales bacterium]
MYENDSRTVMTLDAGGTNFVFTAIRGCREVVEPIRLDAVTDSVARCLEVLTEGFSRVKEALDTAPVAISFAFPGPADYEAGIIGDLPNFPCFRGGVPIGPYLAEQFNLPVFINNDGNLFAYGEALAGTLPEMNARLEAAGSSVRYKNLIGLTLGTGFGAGVVTDSVLLKGDNGCGGDVWLMRNIFDISKIAEESVSIRAVKRVYRELSGDCRELSPKDIFEIADGIQDGDREAARGSFARMGTAIACALAHALDIVDGLVVVGGGLSGAHKYIFPSILEGLKGWLQMDVVDLTTEDGMNAFLKDTAVELRVPGSNRTVLYHSEKKTGIAVSGIGTSTAVSLGAYAYALMQIDK